MGFKRHHILILIVLILVTLDQALKFHIKTNYFHLEEHLILGLPWAKLKFIENPGMAFGLTFGGETGKIILSLFRIFAVGLLIYIVRNLNRDSAKFGLLVCFALILAGAIGNIVDSAIYGIIFSSSVHGKVATFLPEAGGYAKFLHGSVVDMLYFPMVDTRFPQGWPIVGGNRFQFFRPIFNLADTFISTGVIALILFYRKDLTSKPKETQSDLGHEILENA